MIDEGHLLGRRTITGGSGGSVDITVNVPEVDEHGSFYCEFSLSGLSWIGKTRRAYGIDAIQAVYFALQSIGSDLEAFQRSEGLDLMWVGGSRVGDVGLPTIKIAVGDDSSTSAR